MSSFNLMKVPRGWAPAPPAAVSSEVQLQTCPVYFQSMFQAFRGFGCRLEPVRCIQYVSDLIRRETFLFFPPTIAFV